jgi:hypothetical protein
MRILLQPEFANSIASAGLGVIAQRVHPSCAGRPGDSAGEADGA